MRGLKLFGKVLAGYMATILAIVIGGFLDEAVGLWATIAWGAILVLGLVVWMRSVRGPARGGLG